MNMKTGLLLFACAMLGHGTAVLILKKWEPKTSIRIAIAVICILVAGELQYLSSRIYEYDGGIGMHPYELPLVRPALTYVLQAVEGFIALFGIRFVGGRIKKPKE